MKLHNLTHLNISACNIDCHTMIPLCDLLASRRGSPLLSLDLSRNHIGRSGMLLLASMFDDPVLMQLQQLDLRFNNHDGLLPLASAVCEMVCYCPDNQPCKPKRFSIFSGTCKRCGLPKAAHSKARRLPLLQELRLSMAMTLVEDIVTLGEAICDGALPSLLHIDFDHGYFLDTYGHTRRAIEFLMRTVAERSLPAPQHNSHLKPSRLQ